MIPGSSITEDNNQFFKPGRMYRSRDHHNFMFLILKILSKTNWFHHLVVLNEKGKRTIIVAHESHWTEIKKEEQK